MAGARISMRTANTSIPKYHVNTEKDEPIRQIAKAVQTAYSVLGGDDGLAAKVKSWFEPDEEDYALDKSVASPEEMKEKAASEMEGYDPSATIASQKAQEAIQGYKPTSMSWDEADAGDILNTTVNDAKLASSYGRRR